MFYSIPYTKSVIYCYSNVTPRISLLVLYFCTQVAVTFQNAYIEYKEVVGAQGVKIAAKELEKAIAGLNLLVAQKPDEVDVLK